MASRDNGKHAQRHRIRVKPPRTITLPPLPVAAKAVAPATKETAAQAEQPTAESDSKE